MSSASVLLLGGKIYPNAAAPEANPALAIDGERILASGTEEQIRSLADDSTQVINLDGRTVIPGLIDAHLHFEKYTLSLDHLDCDTDALADCLERVRQRARQSPPESWILGHGWDQNAWGGFGTAGDLDRVAPDLPVYLTAHSLHAAWANSRALTLAGIRAGTPDPPGGLIQRDQQGRPTGILFENAMQLVSQVIQPLAVDALAERMLTAQEQLWRYGLTGIHDFDGPRCFTALQLLRERGDLGLRVIKNIPVDLLEAVAQAGFRSGFGDAWLRLGNIKIFADGALGPRTAAMLEPYQEEPDNRGLLLVDQEELTELGLKAVSSGFGLTVHAIGDLANHVVLEALSAVRKQEGLKGFAPLRHRIEHLQLMHPADLRRPAELGLVASMQPIHAISDMQAANRYWGARIRFAYGWRSQLESGARLAFGSDAPVDSPNPFWGLHAALTRKQPDGSPGPEGWVPEERISLSAALAAYTSGPAYAGGLEGLQGQLLPGYMADLIVLEVDPFEIEPDQLRETAPVATMVAGNWRIREF